MVDFLNDEHLSTLNHSCAHVMAQAVKYLYPDAKFWVGPVVNEGFYYDIDLGNDVIKDEDIPKIEKIMKKICKDGKRITREEISKTNALTMFADDPYKMDLITDLDDGTITIYRQGDFVDLCRGPHVETVKACRYFKLMKHSGAYWKGDKTNKVLQRIYGVCLPTQDELDAYLGLLEEAKKRDHKKLGKELDLFMVSEFAPGMPIFLQKGMALRNALETYWYEEHRKERYEFIKTPIMMSKELWELSGHWQNYQENMYISMVDDREFAIKPMNCPGGMLVYKNGLHSYKDLPIRCGELGQVHRHEASGALNGLFRVRTFTQDDAHIFMAEDQIESEILDLLTLIDRIYSTFHLDFRIELSTRPENKYIGSIEDWDRSEAILEAAIKKSGKEYKINPGDGAFYGPKLDFHIRDSLGRSWQCGTIQLDANLPERFDLSYVDRDGSKKRPLMLHRAIFGSIERFIGILIEHYGGAFPTWLAPVQVSVLPVKNEYHLDYANEVFNVLQEQGIRVELDAREEKLGYRIRENQMKKFPFMLILGDNERDDKTISFRRYGEQKSETLKQDAFISLLVEEIKSKK
ncbi:MAG: threonine--tRNA ligase [Breznakia sp.]